MAAPFNYIDILAEENMAGLKDPVRLKPHRIASFTSR